MSDTPSTSSFELLDDDLPYARPRPTWRDRLAGVTEAVDLAPRRVALGLGALAVAALVAWRLLAPAPAPAEMSLPYTPAASPSPSDAGRAAGGAGGTASGVAEGAPGGRAGAAGPGTSVPPGSPGSPTSPVPGGVSGPSGASGSVVDGAPVIVHVAGAVVRPGVQQLSGGARVVDAVDRAGGPTPDAELARVNLAALLQDGQQVYIPRVGEPMPPPPAASAPQAGSGGTTGPASGGPAGPVNLNTASADELDTLPGVGPTTAAAIIAHRQEQGPFTTVDQLLDVRGIGDAKLAELRDLVTVG